MRDPLAWLMVAVFASALGVVHMRQESRSLFTGLESARADRDALDVEWGQLLLEEGAWSQHRRVETAARARLDMQPPEAERIVVVRVGEGR